MHHNVLNKIVHRNLIMVILKVNKTIRGIAIANQMCNLKRISCVHLVSSPKLNLAWWSCFAQHVENLGKIIQDQNNASQKETNNFEASHTRDNSVEPPTPSAKIEVQVPT
jgi:hypothetical protein